MSESTADMQAHLTTLRTAWYDLAAGGKPVTLAYNMGAGSKSVTYTAADRDALRAEIGRLEARLGVAACDRMFRRRAIGVRFG